MRKLLTSLLLILLCGNAFAAVAIVGTPTVVADAGTYTAEAGSNRLVVIAFAREEGATDRTLSVTLGTRSLGAGISTAVNADYTNNNPKGSSTVYYIKEADIESGAQTLDLAFDGSVNGSILEAVIYTLSGVDQTTPVDTTTTLQVTTAADPFTTTIAVANNTVQVMAAWTQTVNAGAGSAVDASATATWTEYWDRNDTDLYLSVSHAKTTATGATITSAINLAAPAQGNMVIASFAPVSVSAPVFSGTVAGQSTVINVAASTLSLSSYFSNSPTSYALSGCTFPSGISLNTSTGDATGTPIYPLSVTGCIVTATNAGGSDATNAFNWTITPGATCGESGTDQCQFVPLTSIALGSPAAGGTLAYDAQSANFAVDEVITGGTSGATAQVVSDTDAGTTGTLVVVVLSGTFQDNEALTGSVAGAATANGTVSFYYAASDVLIAPTMVSPGSYALTIAADGSFSYPAGGDTSRQLAWNISVYDASAVGYAAVDIDYVVNDPPVVCDAAAEQVIVVSSAMTGIDLNTRCSHSLGDTLTFAKVTGTYPPGTTLTTATVGGTPTTEDEDGAALVFSATNPYGGVDTWPLTLYPWTTLTLFDCLSPVTDVVSCESAINSQFLNTLTVTLQSQYSTTVAAFDVISTDPVGGAEVAPYSALTINYSLGAYDPVNNPQSFFPIELAKRLSWLDTEDCPTLEADAITEADANGVWARRNALGRLRVNPNAVPDCPKPTIPAP